MKAKFFCALIGLCLSMQALYAETNGYLSFEYSRSFKNVSPKTEAFSGLQLGVIFSGAFAPAVSYSAELRWRDSRIEPEEAWIAFSSSDSLRVKLGLFLVPFGKYNRENRPHESFLINPPLNVDLLIPPSWREIGLLLEGRIGIFSYALYAGNGLAEGVDLTKGQQFDDNNLNKGWGGRVGLALSQSFIAGYSYSRGKIDTGDSRFALLQCLDLKWNPEGLEVIGEYTRAEIENPEGFAKGISDGYYLQAALSVGKMFPVVSTQKIRYDDAFHGLGFSAPDNPGEGIAVDVSRWTFGLAYSPWPSVLLKLEYESRHDKSVDLNTSALFLQAALSF